MLGLGDIGTLCELQDCNNGQPSMVTGLAFDVQQQMLWSSDDDGYIKCWNLQSFVRFVASLHSKSLHVDKTPSIGTNLHHEACILADPKLASFLCGAR